MNLYLPVEVKDRELYAKLLLAKYAAENGFNVILGKKNDVNQLVMNMPRGVYLGLGIAQNYSNFFKNLSKLGHIIVVCEEEGLITYSDEMYLDMRISPETIKYVDLICTWGEENFNIISNGRNNVSKLRITGNPRFDLLKPAFSGVYDSHIKSIRKKYGNYILVCTSFPSCNHFIKNINYVQSLVEKKTLSSDKSILNFNRYQEVKSSTFKSFLDAIPILAETYSEVDIVIRPHPSENKEVYQALSDKFNNVFVEDSFSVHPWILSSMAVIHHYCTTSIEAFAVQVPRFALRPVKDELSEKEIPFRCSNECLSVEDLIEKIDDIVFSNGGNKSSSQLRKDYEKYVLNIGKSISSELIIQNIIRYSNSNPSKFNQKTRTLHQVANEYRARFSFLLRGVIKDIFLNRKVELKYTSHKFDKLSLNEVKDVVNFYTKNDNLNIKCKRMDRNFVRIFVQ